MLALTLALTSPLAAADPQWVAIGPSAPSEENRNVTSLLLDPASGTLYAGTVGGTVFKYSFPPPAPVDPADPVDSGSSGAPAAPSYDDGTIACLVACIASNENGETIVRFDETSTASGKLVQLEAQHHSGADLNFVLTTSDSNGHESRAQAASAMANTKATLERDPAGNLRLVMAVTLAPSTTMSIEARADGSLTQRLTHGGKTVSQATAVALGGKATLALDSLGRPMLETIVEGLDQNQARIRAWARTFETGEGETGFDSYNAATGTWQTRSSTVDPVQPLEKGHSVEIDGADEGLVIWLLTPVSKDLFF